MKNTALSILSHVSHGYVGNRAVVFPLQYNGWNVDAIHTTNFLNHPGYGQFQGAKSEPEIISDLFDGLRDSTNPEREYRLVVIGYCPSAQVLLAVYKNVIPFFSRSSFPTNQPVLVIDPVLGDNGKLYVPQEIVDVHVNFFSLGLVDLTTPNQFELELLTGMKIDTWENVKQALHKFNKKFSVQSIVLLSVIIDGEMFSVGYSLHQEVKMFSIPITTIKCRFSGCGDVFTALVTHAFCENNRKLTPEILGQVLAKLNKILTISYEEEKARIGEIPRVVQDVRLIQLRKVLGERIKCDFDIKYL